ncbi:MAG: hypothetical protein ABIV21_09195 [Pyrinomonadaceae bacterium]
MTLLFDVPAIGGSGVGLAAGGVFFVVFLVVAYIAFRLLKKTVKMAFRVAIVGLILAIAVAGSIALWAVGTGGSEPARPTRSR